jgi:RNA-binding protein 39
LLISRHSVGYVEFKNEESVAAALQLTGQKLLGIPVIVQLTEAEKNRQVRTTESSGNHPNSIPFHRLYVGNIHFSITEQDLQNVFEPFGELEFVQLQKDDNGRSRGYGFVQSVSVIIIIPPVRSNTLADSAMPAKLGKLWRR